MYIFFFLHKKNTVIRPTLAYLILTPKNVFFFYWSPQLLFYFGICTEINSLIYNSVDPIPSSMLILTPTH